MSSAVCKRGTSMYDLFSIRSLFVVDCSSFVQQRVSRGPGPEVCKRVQLSLKKTVSPVMHSRYIGKCSPGDKSVITISCIMHDTW